MRKSSSAVCQYCGVELNEKMVCPVCGESYAPTRNASERIPKREQLPSFLESDSSLCSVCGYRLDQDSEVCPMCNSPRMLEKEVPNEYRCPICETPMSMDVSVCPVCDVDLTREDEKLEMSLGCPLCQGIIDIDDKECGHCGARIWLDLDEEIRNLEEYRCPVCDEVVQEDAEKCPKCNSDIWLRDEEALRNEAVNKIEEARTQIEMEEKETRSDLSDAVRFLEVARKALEMSDYGKASRCASLSIDLARSAGLQKRMLVDALRRAEKTVALVDKKGGDVVRASELLKNSKEEARKGNYRRAIKMAIRGKVIAEATIGQEAVLMIDADSLE